MSWYRLSLDGCLHHVGECSTSFSFWICCLLFYNASAFFILLVIRVLGLKEVLFFIIIMYFFARMMEAGQPWSGRQNTNMLTRWSCFCPKEPTSASGTRWAKKNIQSVWHVILKIHQIFYHFCLMSFCFLGGEYLPSLGSVLRQRGHRWAAPECALWPAGCQHPWRLAPAHRCSGEPSWLCHVSYCLNNINYLSSGLSFFF